jgi:hypothetical protein
MDSKSIERKEGSGRPHAIDENTAKKIIDAAENDRTLSARKIAKDDNLNPNGLTI